MGITTRCGQFGCCVMFGKFGFLKEERRERAMCVALWSGIATLVLVSISLLALSKNPAIVSHVYWAKGLVHIPPSTTPVLDAFRCSVAGECSNSAGSTSTYYVGLREVVKVKTFNGGGTIKKSFTWGLGKCANVTSNGAVSTADDPLPATNLFSQNTQDALHTVQRFCMTCEKSAKATITSACLALFAAVMCIKFDMSRMKNETDGNDHKFLATFAAGAFSLITGIIALWKFAMGCYKTAPVSVIYDEGKLLSAKWTYGPGFACIFMGTILKVIHVVAHAGVRVPAAEPAKQVQTPAATTTATTTNAGLGGGASV